MLDESQEVPNVAMEGNDGVCDLTLLSYVMAEHGMHDYSEKDAQFVRLLEWINRRGPHVSDAETNGNLELVQKLWELLQSGEMEMSKVKQLEEEYQTQCQKVDKAKGILLARWSQSTSPALSDQVAQKSKEVEQWSEDKKKNW